MPLPKKPNAPITDPSRYTTLIYGEPKIGKTTWASNATKPLFLATEPGTKALEVYDVSIPDWKTLLTTLGEIAKGDHDFETIVIDTIDNAYEFCKAAVCEENGWADPSDGAYGKGFAAINGEFKRVLLKLTTLPYGVILTSHSKDKVFESRTGSYTRTVPSLPDKAAIIVTGMVDQMVHAGLRVRKTDSGQVVDRLLWCNKDDPDHISGGRLQLPKPIPLDYAAYLEAFNKAAKAKKGK